MTEEGRALFERAPTPTIQVGITRTYRHLVTHHNKVVSVSGGADSDCMLHIVHALEERPEEVRYVWFDTGLELQATKEHLGYLEERYGIQIERIKAKMPVAVAVAKYGVPFISKEISERICRAQRNGFQWEDAPYRELVEKYPNTLSVQRWWNNCDNDGKPVESMNNIRNNFALKEWLMTAPPKFGISEKCCTYAKKNTAKEVCVAADLDLVGIRRAEGGVRAKIESCFINRGGDGADKHYPLFYWSDADKAAFEQEFGIVHSRAYTEYGFKRTGCAGCPFNSMWEGELKVLDKYEPQLAKACRKIFGESYDYTRRYRAFRDREKRIKRAKGQLSFDDLQEDF